MSAKKILIGGVALAVTVYLLTFALHLLNQPRDLSVVAGYMILLLMLAACVGLFSRHRKNKKLQSASIERVVKM